MNHHDDEDMTYDLSIPLTLDAYQRQAMQTRSPRADLLYTAGKLTVEAAELQQHVLKAHYHGQPGPSQAMLDELGDVLWYAAAICTKAGLDLGDVMRANIDKLRLRYPAGFSSADSVRRVDVEQAQREVQP